VAAWALVQRGVRVVLLETGPRYQPLTYGSHEQDFEITPSPFRAVSMQEGRRSYDTEPGEPLDPDFAHLASDSFTLMAGPPLTHRNDFRWERALGVGGSTLHYSGEAHRFPPHAFRMRSQRGVAADWPLGYDDLAPYYDRVEKLVGVAGEPGNPFKASRGPFPNPAHPLSAASRHFEPAAKRLGWQLLPNTLAALSRPRPDPSLLPSKVGD